MAKVSHAPFFNFRENNYLPPQSKCKLQGLNPCKFGAIKFFWYDIKMVKVANKIAKKAGMRLREKPHNDVFRQNCVYILREP